MSKFLNKGQLFNNNLSKEIRDKFCHLDYDPLEKTKRVFFDNAGGAIRLKQSNDVFQVVDSYPDCAGHSNKAALKMMEIIDKGINDTRIIFNAKDGVIATSLTASSMTFEITRAIIENVPGSNVVTTVLEHPSSFDAIITVAKETGKEVRIAKANKETGGVDADEIINLVDEDTCLLSVIYASNISGAVLDVSAIVKEARKKKVDLYIISDSVQHMPHDLVDVENLNIDALTFAPYKFFAPRGMGLAYLSDRASKLPHNKVIADAENKWELGSPAPSHFAAITELVNYVSWIGSNFSNSQDRRALFAEGMKRINLHERALLYHMLEGTESNEGLRHIAGVKILVDYDDLSKRDLIVPIKFENLKSEDAVMEYEKEGIVTFERVNSSPYSARMLEALGLTESVRVSPIHCHTLEDVDKFLKTTKKIASEFSK